MNLCIVRTAFLVVGVTVLAPFTAHAQGAYCELFYCTAYGVWNSGQITGYVEYWDDTEGWDLSVDAYAQDPDGVQFSCEDCSAETYDDVTAYVTYNTGMNGVWSIVGYPYFNIEGQWIEDGWVDYDIGVFAQPTGETINPYMPTTDVVGEYFINYLKPSYYDFDGSNVSETFSGSPTDTCYANYRKHDSGPGAYTPAAGGGPVAGNNYLDEVGAGSNWVSYYQAQLAGTTYSCQWSISQNVYYDASPLAFAQNTIGSGVTANDYYTFRGACTVDGGNGGYNGCGD
jgi:hypothetical protein